MLIGLQDAAGLPQVLGKELSATNVITLVVAAYLAGQMVATPAKALLEGFIVRLLLKPPSFRLMQPVTGRRVWWYLFPEYFRPLQPVTQELIRQRARAEGLTGRVDSEEFLEYIRCCHDIRSDVSLAATLNTFLNKYGLTRNMCFVSLLYLIAPATMQLLGRNFGMPVRPWHYAFAAGTAAIFLFYRYLKFYRQHAYELFLAYARKA